MLVSIPFSCRIPNNFDANCVFHRDGHLVPHMATYPHICPVKSLKDLILAIFPTVWRVLDHLFPFVTKHFLMEIVRLFKTLILMPHMTK